MFAELTDEQIEHTAVSLRSVLQQQEMPRVASSFSPGGVPTAGRMEKGSVVVSGPA